MGSTGSISHGRSPLSSTWPGSYCPARMDLDRRNIEKRDFSQARRGYDPGEVDRHLTAIAEAVEQLRQAQAHEQQPTSLAGAAATRVEAIVAAAEASAREIEENARAEAAATREQAERDAAERVANAQEMVTSLTSRAQELEREVQDFVGRVGGLKAAVDSVRTDFDAAAPSSGESLDLDVGSLEPEPEIASLDLGAAEPDSAPEPVPAAAPAKDGQSSEGARLIALNMALSGTPREETARYLRENFDLDDQDDLLDDVYARAGG